MSERIITVHLAPPDATLDEMLKIQRAAYPYWDAIVGFKEGAAWLATRGSTGDVTVEVKEGAAWLATRGSTGDVTVEVVVWDGTRWSEDIVGWLREQGVKKVELRLLNIPTLPTHPQSSASPSPSLSPSTTLSPSASASPSAEPPEPISAGSKLGPHIIAMGGDAGDMLKAGCAVAKFAGDWGSAPMAPESTFIVGRKVIVGDDIQHYRSIGMTPSQAVHEFLYGKEAQIATYRANPRIRFWEGHNEPVWGDLDGMAWYANFEIDRMTVMGTLGLKCVIGNFATGTPPMELWPAFLPACKYALDYGHVLGLHEYSLPWLWWMTGRYQMQEENCVNPQDSDRLWGWTTLRYRQVYDTYLKPAGMGNLPLVITEFGVDPMVGPSPDWCPQAAWKDLAGTWSKHDKATAFDYVRQEYPRPADVPAFQSKEQFYFEQLKWYDRQIRQDSYVIGATIFTYGSFGGAWERFDVQDTPVGDALTQYVCDSLQG